MDNEGVNRASTVGLSQQTPIPTEQSVTKKASSPKKKTGTNIVREAIDVLPPASLVMKNYTGTGDNDLKSLIKSTLENSKMQKVFNREKEGGKVQRAAQRVQF